MTGARYAGRLDLRNLVTSLILYESVVTTAAKAAAAAALFDHLINRARRGGALNGRRALLAFLTDSRAADKIVDELMARFGDRPSGLTRRLKTVRRDGDAAQSVVLALVDSTDAHPTATEQKSRRKIEPKAKS